MAFRLARLTVALAFWCGLISTAGAEQPGANIHLDVYKSPTCGCCIKWMDHLSENGITATGRYGDADSGQRLGVPLRYGSCHTGVSGNGFVFEGHVPARYIRQFLENPPDNALGLSVPAMPIGSPGMEFREEFMPYDVLLLHKDGSATVYVSVASYDEQFEQTE